MQIVHLNGPFLVLETLNRTEKKKTKINNNEWKMRQNCNGMNDSVLLRKFEMSMKLEQKVWIWKFCLKIKCVLNEMFVFLYLGQKICDFVFITKKKTLFVYRKIYKKNEIGLNKRCGGKCHFEMRFH